MPLDLITKTLKHTRSFAVSLEYTSKQVLHSVSLRPWSLQNSQMVLASTKEKPI